MSRGAAGVGGPDLSHERWMDGGLSCRQEGPGGRILNPLRFMGRFWKNNAVFNKMLYSMKGE